LFTRLTHLASMSMGGENIGPVNQIEISSRRIRGYTLCNLKDTAHNSVKRESITHEP